MKQCPNCHGNLADYVPVCPYCGVQVAVVPMGVGQPAWTGAQETSGKATASLICGIFFLFWPSALAAIILGHLSLSDIRKSAGRLAGHGKAVAGLVLGYVGLAFIPVILIIAAIAIPNLLRSRMAANEASAVGSLRTYNTAMVTYSAACPDIGYPASLESLGPGSKDCSHADLVDLRLSAASPVKSGYRFSYSAKRGTEGLITSYALTADPITQDTSGRRHFFTDQSGVIRYSMDGEADADSLPLM